MLTVKRAVIMALGAVTTGLYFAAPAGADPGSDPCHAAFISLCRIFPAMPDLDHDIDLTQDPDAWTTGQEPASQPGAGQPASTQPPAGLGG